MKDTEEHYHPLPPRQYLGYVIFFAVLTLGSLTVALVWTLSSAREGPGWREVVIALLLLAQMGLFLGLLMLNPAWPLSQGRLRVYFGSSLALWLVGFWLAPQLWWLNLAYLGQMAGLMPARAMLLTAALASVAFFVRNLGFAPLQEDIASVLGMYAQWASVIVMYLFMNQLIRTSQDRGKLIARLETAKKELELAQQREAELAVLRERERLARDLHDSLGHTLVALSVQLEAIQRLYRVDPGQASAQVDEMKALTRSSMDALRRSIAGLRAPGLGDQALRPALQALCVDFGERTGLEITCQVDPAADQLRPALAEALWRLTQEALTNAEKHAQARSVGVSVACGSSAVTVHIADDGVGLPPGAESYPNRFGLRGMRERVEGLGGTLVLDGSERGTVVEACLPTIAANAGGRS
jgi:signal transduction histidine kinase